MSFAFDFDGEELDESPLSFDGGASRNLVNDANVSSSMLQDGVTSGDSPAASVAPKSLKARGKMRCEEIPLQDLIDQIPPRLSFTPFSVPLRRSSSFAKRHAARNGSDPSSSSSKGEAHVTLYRRDLFDARFQLLLAESEATDEADDSSPHPPPTKTEAIDASTDLIPDVYEGGLKTWECSLDLVSVLHNRFDSKEHGSTEELHGATILDVGCGTAVPTAYLLRLLLGQQTDKSKRKTRIHLLDYNLQVLQLVTLPNLLLAWYFSPAAEGFRAQQPPTYRKQSKKASSAEAQEAGQLPGELSTDDLITAFQSSLKEYGIELRFFAGDWAGFLEASSSKNEHDDDGDGKYDLILTSETIYSPDAQDSFVSLLRQGSRRSTSESISSVSSALSQAQLRDTTSSPAQPQRPESQAPSTLCLVAAKILYFGVGGGVQSFKQAVQGSASSRGWVEEVDKIQSGVGRVVLSVGWE